MKRKRGGAYQIYVESGTEGVNHETTSALQELTEGLVGEVYLNSIDQDGTGQGYDLGMLEYFSNQWNTPLILAGGVGNESHLAKGFEKMHVDAVATAHLFNFMGNGLQKARENLLKRGVKLARWPTTDKNKQ